MSNAKSEQVARGCDVFVLSCETARTATSCTKKSVYATMMCQLIKHRKLTKTFSFFFFILVESLIYWRDVKKSGVVFGIGLAILLAMSMFSLISVFAYLSLLTLVGTISFRIYKTIMSAVQKTSEGHPFKYVSTEMFFNVTSYLSYRV